MGMSPGWLERRGRHARSATSCATCDDPSIPCHRVTGANGALGGYVSSPLLKRYVPIAEGITLRGGRLRPFARVRWNVKRAHAPPTVVVTGSSSEPSDSPFVFLRVYDTGGPRQRFMTRTLSNLMSDAGRAAEAELVARCRGGELDAFEDVYRQIRPGDNLAFRMVGNAADADDLLQEMFLTAYRKLDTFRGASALGTWLDRLGMNVCLDRLRSKAARQEQVTDMLRRRAWSTPTKRGCR